MPTYNEIGSGGVVVSGLSEVSDRVIFDGLNRLIIINGSGIISVRDDIYSNWKLWVMEKDNAKWIQAMSSTGGDPLPGDEALGSTYFLLNNWKIQLHNNVTIDGNLFTDDGSFPYVTENNTILAQSKVSTLVERITDVNDNARIFV